MCGRYALYGPISRHRTQKEDDASRCWDSLVGVIDERAPRHNVASTDRMSMAGVSRKCEMVSAKESMLIG